MVERLHRLDWVFERAPIYFITACTDRRQTVLADARVMECLLQFAENGPEFGAWLGAFVLMPDHLHAFVALDESDDPKRLLKLGRWMKALKGSISKVLREAGCEGRHWQKGFFDRVLRFEESYAQKWDYVRQNPVRAGLVSQWEDWPYWAQPFPLEHRGDP